MEVVQVESKEGWALLGLAGHAKELTTGFEPGGTLP